MSDEETPRYAAGFRQAVRRLLGPKAGWSTTYTDDAAYAQAIARAYQAGRLDGVSEALGPIAAPGPVDVEPEAPRESREQVYERLGLFEAPVVPPVLASVVLDPLVEPVRSWEIRQTRATLDLSLAEATEFVRSLHDD